MLTPTQIEQRLQDLEQDLAHRQNAYASAAEKWYRVLRDREHRHAVEFMRAEGQITERKEQAKQETALIGQMEEAEYEGLRAAIKVMETRAMIGMALLKAANRDRS
jgi:hypothetical protein